MTRSLTFLVPLLSLAQSSLHQQAFVFDAHVHVINRQFHDGSDIGKRLQGGQVDLPRARAGGIDAMFFSLYVPEEYYPPRYETRHVLRLIDLAHDQIRANSSQIELAFTAADIDRIHKSGKIAAWLDLEGGFDLDGDLGILRMLHRLGLRSAQLPAHNWTNSFADSCCARAKHNGLTEHGRAVVREMNRLGMVINISHASDETIEQTLDVSMRPIIATHHGMRALNDIPRNMPDALMRKLAANGGVIAFHIGNEFHNRKMFDWRTARAGKPFWDTKSIGEKESRMEIAAIDRLLAPRFPMVGLAAPEELLFSVDEWIAVIERAISIVGEDHVALGSDFDGGPTPPRGITDISHLPLLTEAMQRRNWPEQRIRKFLGGNLLRLVQEAGKAGR
ncbi:MAG: membrane dipeptidase [Acidimicrobiia bacterium]|nr:membrane dipeptidase [Acidimicrobiia bacterium]